MRILRSLVAIFGLFLLVSTACSTSRPERLGDNEWTIRGRSMSKIEAKEQAVKGAKCHCRKQGSAARILEVKELCRERIDEIAQVHYVCE